MTRNPSAGDPERLRTVLLRLLCVAILPVVVGAFMQVDPVFAQEKAFTMPRSNLLIYGTLLLPEGREIHFGSREGTLVVIEDVVEETKLGFTLAREGRGETASVRVRLYTITMDEKGGEDLHLEDQEVIAFSDSVQLFLAGEPLEIRVAGGEEGEFNDGSLLAGVWHLARTDPDLLDQGELEKLYGPGSGEVCCTLCNGILACASSISDDCGGCSSGGFAY